MRRRLFIHIGMSKAGSSAIQSALLNQEGALKKAHILNPDTGRRRGAHWGLAEEIRDAKEPILFPRLAAASRDIPITVISCEAFWFCSDAGISRLLAATNEWDVRIILYLRRPGDFLGSSYRQHIKSGKITETTEEFLAGAKPWLAYDKMVIRWSNYFPLTVRVYDSLRTRIEEDFLELVGAGHLKPERRVVNGTPSDGATRVMLATNRCFSKRSRRHRINMKILAMQKYFSWMSPIDNTAFHEAACWVVADWDREVLLRFLPEEDLAALAAA